MVWDLMGPFGVVFAATASIWTWTSGRQVNLRQDLTDDAATRAAVISACAELADAASDLVDLTMGVYAARGTESGRLAGDDQIVLDPRGIEDVVAATHRLQHQMARVVPQLPPSARAAFIRHVDRVVAAGSACLGQGPMDVVVAPAAADVSALTVVKAIDVAGVPSDELDVDLSKASEKVVEIATSNAAPIRLATASSERTG